MPKSGDWSNFTPIAREPDTTFHVAKHSFATTVTMMNGAPIESVAKCLVPKNVTTQNYARIVDKKVVEDMNIPSKI